MNQLLRERRGDITLFRDEVAEEKPHCVRRHDRNVDVADGCPHVSREAPCHNSWQRHIDSVSGGYTASTHRVPCKLNVRQDGQLKIHHDVPQSCGDDAGGRSLVLIVEEPVEV